MVGRWRGRQCVAPRYQQINYCYSVLETALFKVNGARISGEDCCVNSNDFGGVNGGNARYLEVKIVIVMSK